jgi:hypothetical protein
MRQVGARKILGLRYRPNTRQVAASAHAADSESSIMAPFCVNRLGVVVF